MKTRESRQSGRRKKETKNKVKNFKITNMVVITPTTSIITVHVNGLNIPIKRWKMSKWIETKFNHMLSTKKSTFNK